MINTLGRLCLNTAEFSTLGRDKISHEDDYLDAIATILSSGGGTIATDIHLTVQTHATGSGFAFYSFSNKDGQHLSACSLVYDPVAADEQWKKILTVARKEHSACSVLKKPPVPCISVVRLDLSKSLKQSELDSLTDLENCAAWAFLIMAGQYY